MRGLKLLFLEQVTMTREGFGFLEAKLKVGFGDVVGLWASECWVVGIASVIVIKGKGEGSVYVVVVEMEVIGRKDTSGHQ